MRALLCLTLLACDPVVLEADPRVDLAPPADAGVPDVAPTPAPCIELVSEAELDFGPVDRGRLTEQVITLVGCREQSVAIDSVRVDVNGADPGFDVPGQAALTLAAPRTPDAPVARAAVKVTFRPLASGREYSATVTLTTTDPLRPEITVRLTGRGAWTGIRCEPWTVRVDEATGRAHGPGTAITLVADPPPGLAREAAEVRWLVRDRPAGSVSNPVERFDDPDDPAAGGTTDDQETPEAEFFIDEAGVYIFEARTKLPSAADCPDQSAELRIVACPCPGDLHVQLRWLVDPDDPPPVGIRSNLDLHLAHPDAIVWNDPLHDCRSVNPTPDWGVAGLDTDDPLLDADDADAPGVENIFIERLQRPDSISGSYRIGVEHVRPEWTALASVEIRVRGELVWSADRALGEVDGWWDVAALGWNEGTLSIATLDRTFESRPPLDATLRPGAECLPEMLPPCSPNQTCQAAPGDGPWRCQ